MIKKIAAITMVRNDNFFLHKWVEYYGEEFGRDNLFVYFDGRDQEIPDFCEGINAFKVDKIGNTVRSSDKGRIKFISDKARQLFDKGYNLVVGGDADEYLVADPLYYESLKDYLNENEIRSSISGLGLDFGQKLPKEGPLSLNSPFLSQRRYAQIGTRYTKASVMGRPLEWGSGFHRIEGHNFHIPLNLYLMHFGYSDLGMIESRLSNADRLQQGWEKHMNKRKRTIRYANTLPARDFDKIVGMARKIETIARHPYAWNKPGLLGLKLMVKIPDRFRNSL